MRFFNGAVCGKVEGNSEVLVGNDVLAELLTKLEGKGNLER